MIPIETQIFRLIFPPAGAIPLEKLEAVPHIRQHINSIIDLASTEHGIATPSESAALTARVIELRDTPGPDGKVRTWRTIAEICGTTIDAVRHRYANATIRKSRIVEDAALTGYDIKDKLAEFQNIVGDPVPQDDAAQPEEPQEAEATGDRLEPVAISRKELDLRMWDLHQTGKTPEEISDILFAERLYYKPKSIRVRLLSQGAIL